MPSELIKNLDAARKAIRDAQRDLLGQSCADLNTALDLINQVYSKSVLENILCGKVGA